jgi:hypothetical protein
VCVQSRGAAATVFVTCAILLSSVNGVVGGFASTFPSIFITTMVFLYIDQEEGVGAGAVGPMMLGSTAVSAYAMTFAGFASLGWHPLLCALVTWPCALLTTSLPVAAFLRRMRSRAALPSATDDVSVALADGGVCSEVELQSLVLRKEGARASAPGGSPHLHDGGNSHSSGGDADASPSRYFDVSADADADGDGDGVGLLARHTAV